MKRQFLCNSELDEIRKSEGLSYQIEIDGGVSLDNCQMLKEAGVDIIHGHGTGALKSAVQDFLSTSPYVAKYRFGENTEGGDGVSIVDIN